MEKQNEKWWKIESQQWKMMENVIVFSLLFFIGICVSLFFIIFHCFFLQFFIMVHCCFSMFHHFSLFFIFFIIFHCFFSLFHHSSLLFRFFQHILFFSMFHHVSLFVFPLFFSSFFTVFSIFLIGFHCFFPLVHHFSLLFSLFSIIFHFFQLFNVILWALIRLKNTKTDKIEYFGDPGVTWFQIIYVETFHCVERFVCWFPRYVYIYII